jgi:nucleotidyltransferase substrate binding protein (TIGR01987 family)
MNLKDKRWRQRFQNFSKVYANLKEAVAIEKMSDLERAGLIQYFEFTFELGWKTLKDYLESEGYDVKSPRETIKQAFQIEFISDGKVWLEALEDRNLMTHAYDEDKSQLAAKRIRENYFTLLTELYDKFSKLDS